MRGAAVAAIAVAAAVAGALASSCAGPPGSRDTMLQKRNEITQLWAQIRDWRHEAHMSLDPTPQDLIAWGARPARDAARVCPENHAVPASCGDVCNLGDDICDNAERICSLADELGRDDRDAQEKCSSAKASCREAKQRCCDCSSAPAAVQP